MDGRRTHGWRTLTRVLHMLGASAVAAVVFLRARVRLRGPEATTRALGRALVRLATDAALPYLVEALGIPTARPL